MIRMLLVRGMVAGLLAGLLVFGFARVFGEPPVDRAIGFEAAADAARAHEGEALGMHMDEQPELVSRATQAGLGLFTGVMVYATAWGGLFALVFAVADRRIARLGARGNAALLAACGFVAVYLVPTLKYPANPPAVGQPDTIGQRTALYAAMLGLSVLVMVGAAVLRRRLQPRLGGWSAALLAGAAYLVAVAAVAALLPVVDEVPPDFPAAVLWQFRVASFGMQAILWTTLGLGFGWAADRLQPSRPLLSGARAW